jgi:ABC-type glycerol-3-phosphate transport system permease component
MNETARGTAQVATGRAAALSQRPARTAEVGRIGRRATMGDAIASAVAVLVALIFFFPIYWAASNSLRRPVETFTVAGLGIPFVNFTPTL